MSKNIFDISIPHGNLDMRNTKVGLTPRVLHGMQTAIFSMNFVLHAQQTFLKSVLQPKMLT